MVMAKLKKDSNKVVPCHIKIQSTIVDLKILVIIQTVHYTNTEILATYEITQRYAVYSFVEDGFLSKC